MRYLIIFLIHILLLSCSSQQPSDLWDLAKAGNLTEIKRKITSGVNVDARDSDSCTALLYASENGRLEVIKYLISKGADVKAISGYHHETALMKAGENGHLEVVKYLIAKGADVKSINISHETVLIKAGENGHLEVVKYLVEQQKMDVNAKDYAYFTVLMKVIMSMQTKNDLAVVKYLVEHGADVKAKDLIGETALMCACLEGNLQVVKYLIKKGSDVNGKTNSGCTVLMKAICSTGSGETEKVVKYLVAQGVNVNEKDYDGRTALMEASFRGNLDVVKYLVAQGANVNEKDFDRRTALSVLYDDYGTLQYPEIGKYLKSVGAK